MVWTRATGTIYNVQCQKRTAWSKCPSNSAGGEGGEGIRERGYHHPRACTRPRIRAELNRGRAPHTWGPSPNPMPPPSLAPAPRAPSLAASPHRFAREPIASFDTRAKSYKKTGVEGVTATTVAVPARCQRILRPRRDGEPQDPRIISSSYGRRAWRMTSSSGLWRKHEEIHWIAISVESW